MLCCSTVCSKKIVLCLKYFTVRYFSTAILLFGDKAIRGLKKEGPTRIYTTMIYILCSTILLLACFSALFKTKNREISG